LTAASFGHKQARAFLGIIIENGLIPSKEVIEEYTKEGAKFDYLPLISDIKSFIKHDNYSLVEFKQEM
jgi:hypothetical protein